jgi:hypothetical protein
MIYLGTKENLIQYVNQSKNKPIYKPIYKQTKKSAYHIIFLRLTFPTLLQYTTLKYFIYLWIP